MISVRLKRVLPPLPSFVRHRCERASSASFCRRRHVYAALTADADVSVGAALSVHGWLNIRSPRYL